jgi:hypothetical protein
MTTATTGKTTLASFALGVLLVAILFGLPTFVGAALLLKLFHSGAIVAGSQGVVGFVVSTSLLTGLLAGWLGPRYPKLFVGSYEPEFFDATLSLSEKVSRWLAEPRCRQRVLTTMLMVSMLSLMVMAEG